MHCGLKTTFVTEPVGHEVFNRATEDTNRQIQLVTVTPSVRLSVFLFVSLLSVSICMWLRITASLSVFPFPSVTLFPLILFSVCGLVCRSLSITPRCSCVCVCVYVHVRIRFFFSLKTRLPLSSSLHFCALSSSCLLSLIFPRLAVSLSISIRLFICLSRSVLAHFFFSLRGCVSLCFTCTDAHIHTPACLPSLGSMGTCKWDKGGENKQIKLQSRLFTLASFFYEPPNP